MLQVNWFVLLLFTLTEILKNEEPLNLCTVLKRHLMLSRESKINAKIRLWDISPIFWNIANIKVQPHGNHLGWTVAPPRYISIACIGYCSNAHALYLGCLDSATAPVSRTAGYDLLIFTRHLYLMTFKCLGFFFLILSFFKNYNILVYYAWQSSVNI